MNNGDTETLLHFPTYLISFPQSFVPYPISNYTQIKIDTPHPRIILRNASHYQIRRWTDKVHME